MTRSARVYHLYRTSLLLAIAFVACALAAPLRADAAGWSDMRLFPSANVVVVGTAADEVRAYDTRSANLVWSRKIEAATAAQILDSDGDCVLIYASGLKVAQLPDAGRDAQLHIDAVEPRSGDVRWSTVISGSTDASPAAGIHDGLLYVPYRTKIERPAGHFVAVDLKSGVTAWRLAADVKSFCVEGDTVYLVVEGRNAPPEEGQEAQDRAVASPEPVKSVGLWALDAVGGKIRWKSTAIAGVLKSSPHIVGSTAIIATKIPHADGTTVTRFTGMRTRDGSPAWTREFLDSAYDELKLSGPVLVARNSKRMSVFDARSGGVQWDMDIAAPGSELQSTAVSGDVVYVLSASSRPARFTLLALDLNGGHELGSLNADGSPESPLRVLSDQVLLGVRRVRTHGLPEKDRKTQHVLLGFSTRTLQPRWSAARETALGNASLTELKSALVIRNDTRVAALAPDDGHELWSFAVDLATGPVFDGSAVLYGDNELNLVLVDTTHPKQPPITRSTKMWFDTNKLPNLAFVVVIVLLILIFVAHARGGRPLFIRRIAGLNALDEAVGRATEMGKPVLYIPGTEDVDEIETLAGLSILGHVARRAAEYETPLLVPCRRSIVMSAGQEVVKEAHLKAGRPDSYQKDNIRYLTDDQFGFTAGVDGIMVRERPAANFYMGAFYGESLILAETGHATGAIQIAGTAQVSQMPFFVAACDYTLLGEELFAASAYLSRNPMEVGSLKGQDYAKVLIMVFIVVSCFLYVWWPEVKVWLSQ